MDKGSDVHGKSGNSWEMVQHGDIVTTSHYYESYLTYETVTVPMTLNDIESGAPNEDLLTCNFCVHICGTWQDFSSYTAPCCHCVIAELVV